MEGAHQKEPSLRNSFKKELELLPHYFLECVISQLREFYEESKTVRGQKGSKRVRDKKCFSVEIKYRIFNVL